MLKDKGAALGVFDKSASAAIITVFAALLCWPIIAGNMSFLFSPSDGPIHMLWAQQFIKGMHSGLIYPRWPADVNAGLGSASFIFYPPFTFYTYAAAGIFTDSVPYSMAASVVAGMLASGFSMYIFSRSFLGRLPAVVSAVFYMASPYHIADLYYRSFLAEYWAFFWPPLIFYPMHIMAEDKKKKLFPFACLSFSYAGLILTHLPTALLFTIFALFYVLVPHRGKFTARPAFLRAVSLGAGIGLSAIYLLPAVFEQRFVNINAVTGEAFYDFRNNFLFSSLTGDPALNSLLSKAAVFMLPLIVFIIILLAAGRGKHRNRRIEWYFSVAGIFSFVMTIELSSALWQFVPLIKTVQFPYRWLTVMTFSASFLAGAISSRLNSADIRKPKKTLLGLLFLGLLFINFQHSFRILKEYEGFETPEKLLSMSTSDIRPDMQYADMEKNYPAYAPFNKFLLDVPEYRPIWSEGGSEGVILIPEAMPYGTFLNGRGSIEALRWRPQERLLHADVHEPGIALIRTFFYPGWKARVDGVETEISPHQKTGLIVMKIPSGSHSISLRFEGTALYRAGVAVSLASLGFIIFSAILLACRKRKEIPCEEQL